MWISSSYTDTGKVRTINEDSILDLAEENLWLVADGMGGHANGDYASQLVVSSLRDYCSSIYSGICKARIIRALTECNTHLVEKARRDQVDVIGCTVAVLHARAQNVVCSWSGDSRIYRVRNGVLTQLTRDHSHQFASDDRDRLHQPERFIESSQLTGAIGGDTDLALEHCWYGLSTGDTFLLCTDGLNKEVNDDEILAALSLSGNGEQSLEVLADLYQSRGARDNIGMIYAADYQ